MTQDGIIVNPKNVVSVVEWDRLSTNIDVCIFFCLARYYHQFAKPVTELRVLNLFGLMILRRVLVL